MTNDLEQIRQQAKKIMDEFVAALEAVPEDELEVGFDRAEGVRAPGKSTADPEFNDRMLKNAPKVKDGCIAAEKKGW